MKSTIKDIKGKYGLDFNVLRQLSESAGKSEKILLFEYEQDRHPRTFKRWLKEEQLRKAGKLASYVCGGHDKTPIIELVDGKLVETPFPEDVRDLWGDLI